VEQRPVDTATEIAARVRAGEQAPDAAVRAALTRIRARDRGIGAFRRVRDDAALAEARALVGRDDLAELPLAGVPVAVKDVLAVTGESVREGSAATADAPATEDDVLVTRMRAAGAVVMGLTNVPELCAFGSTDSVFGTTRNPWNPAHTAGGSSGGSAAALAAGMVPIAHGTDGMGSIRGPAAVCGLVGLKPGRGVVPTALGSDNWFGLASSGPMATTVADVALLGSVLADAPDWRDPQPPAAPLRIGVAAGTPSPILRLHPAHARALERVGDLLARAGHRVGETRLPYPLDPTGQIARWTAGVAADIDAAGLDRRRLDKRTRRHAAVGRVLDRLGRIDPRQIDRLAAATDAVFDRVDVVLTPVLAQPAPRARRWSERGWTANMVSSVRYAPYPPLWNLLGRPAMSVPAGRLPGSGLPIGVQLAGPAGSEALLLAVARQIEQAAPWPRHVDDVDEPGAR